MRLSLETGDLANLAYLLDATAVLEAADGTARAGAAAGRAPRRRSGRRSGSHGYGYYRPDPDALAAAQAEARSHLGGDRYDDALDLGRALAARGGRRAGRSESGPPRADATRTPLAHLALSVVRGAAPAGGCGHGRPGRTSRTRRSP